jgi:hypothetical protein
VGVGGLRGAWRRQTRCAQMVAIAERNGGSTGNGCTRGTARLVLAGHGPGRSAPAAHLMPGGSPTSQPESARTLLAAQSVASTAPTGPPTPDSAPLAEAATQAGKDAALGSASSGTTADVEAATGTAGPGRVRAGTICGTQGKGAGSQSRSA